MVALQILVLFVRVRVLTGQLTAKFAKVLRQERKKTLRALR